MTLAPDERYAAIIGTGAIGLMVGAELQKLGWHLAYFGRRGPVLEGGRIDLGDGAQVRLVCVKPPNAGVLQRVSLAFVAVKAFDLAAALAHAQLLPASTPVISLVNGDIEAVISDAARRDSQRIYRLGLCTIGVSAVGDTKDRTFAVRSKGGEIGFGPRPDDTHPRTAAEAAIAGHGPFKWHAQAAWSLRRKWLYNTVINSLTAARRLPRNGALLGDLPMLAAVFDEAFRLGAARWQAWPLPRAELYAGLLALIEATAENENSMARDVRQGRRTETEYLAGVAPKGSYPLLNDLHRQLQTEAHP